MLISNDDLFSVHFLGIPDWRILYVDSYSTDAHVTSACGPVSVFLYDLHEKRGFLCNDQRLAGQLASWLCGVARTLTLQCSQTL